MSDTVAHAPMEQSKFQNATVLRDSGRWDDAAREFHLLAADAHSRDEKAALLINEHRCYCDGGRLDEAERVLSEIRELAPGEPVVRLTVDFGEACMNLQAGEPERALAQFQETLRRYADLLKTSHHYLYESIQKRRGVALANLGKYGEAVVILEEAASFTALTAEDAEEVDFYLGVSYEELGKIALAIAQYRAAIDLGLKNEFEAHAHYRIAIIYFKAGAFAQAKQHLESILQTQEGEITNLPKRYVYEQLSRTCKYLDEPENAKKYLELSKRS